MECNAEIGIDIIGIGIRINRVRPHVTRQTELAVALGREKIHLTTLLSDQYVRAGDIGAAGQVKGNEGDLARAQTGDTAGSQEVLDVR